MAIIIDPKHKYFGERAAVVNHTLKMYEFVSFDNRRPDNNIFNYNAAGRVDTVDKYWINFYVRKEHIKFHGCVAEEMSAVLDDFKYNPIDVLQTWHNKPRKQVEAHYGKQDDSLLRVRRRLPGEHIACKLELTWG